MNSDAVSQIRFIRGVSIFLAAIMVLGFVSLSSSQPVPRPPSWSVQAADPTHGLLTLRGSVMVGVDTGMFYVVQFRIQGTGTNQLVNFQPSMPVTLESSGGKLQSSSALGATVGGKAQQSVVTKSPAAGAVFTSIPTVGQPLLIQASGVPAIEGVVVSVSGPQSYTAGQPGQACCAVTAFNPQTGIARAKVNTSDEIFMFQAPLSQHEGPPPLPGQPPRYQQINIGQPVWANLTAGQVSLDGRTICCQITAEGTSLSGNAGKRITGPVMNPSAGNSACCEITALNQQAKTATAKVKSNGQVFQIAITNLTLFQSLRVGQPIWANFQTRQVSLNGVGPVDGMQIAGSANVNGPLIAKSPGTTLTGGKPPYTAIPSPNSPPLSIHDHTLIMQAVIQNRAWLLQRISHHNWGHATPRQLTIGALLYLLKSNSVPEPTKERIRVAVQALRSARWNRSTTTNFASARTSNLHLRASLRSARTPSAALKILNALHDGYKDKPPYTAALTSGGNLLEDGATTIYSPNWLSQNFQAGRLTPYVPKSVASAREPKGGGLALFDIDLLPCGNAGSDDIGGGCVGGGGGSPFPGECDPSDPVCSNPPNCSDGSGLDCPPGCPDPNDPACSECSDPSNPACVSPPPQCPDPNNPACNTSPPSGCPDANNPDCSTSPPLVCLNPDCSAIGQSSCDPATNPSCTQPSGPVLDCPGCDLGGKIASEDTAGCLTTVGVVSVGLLIFPPAEGAHVPAIPGECALGGIAASVWEVLKGGE